MADLSAPADRQAKGEGRIISVPLAKEVEVFYKGALIMADSSGYAIVGADTASCKFLGIAAETVTQATEAAADGTNYLQVFTKGDFLIVHTTGDAAVTDLGVVMCIDGDNAVDDAGTTTNDIPCGIVADFESVGYVWVRIDNYAPAAV